MEPQRLLAGHGGDAGQVVDDPGVGGARRGHHPHDVAGTVRRVQGGAQGLPVSRWSTHGTTSGSTQRMDSARPTEACASSLTAMTGRPPARPRSGGVVSRATTSADRLAMDPPDTKQPPAPAGSPARPARKVSAWFSAATAPAASNHDGALQRRARHHHVEQQGGLGGGGGDEGQKAAGCRTTPPRWPGARRRGPARGGGRCRNRPAGPTTRGRRTGRTRRSRGARGRERGARGSSRRSSPPCGDRSRTSDWP